MEFRYFKFPIPESDFFGNAILRPVIPIRIKGEEFIVKYNALIDSGADFNIFHGELGDLLGIEVKGGKRERFSGVQAGNLSEAFLHEITVLVGEHEFTTPVWFSYEIAPHSYGILGQKGFFDLFAVKFDYTKEEIELKDRKVQN